MLKMQKDVQFKEALLFDEIVKRGLIGKYGVAVDIGAHVGSWTVKMAEKFSQVFAFEPGMEAFAALRENAGEFENINTYQVAVTDKIGPVEVFAPTNHRNKVKRSLTGRQVRFSDVPNSHSVTVDSLELDGCDFMKIDVEGCEPLVLDGAAATIEAYRPVICIEIGGLSKRFGYSRLQVAKRVKRMGYRLAFTSGVDHIFVPKG